MKLNPKANRRKSQIRGRLPINCMPKSTRCLSYDHGSNSSTYSNGSLSLSSFLCLLQNFCHIFHVYANKRFITNNPKLQQHFENIRAMYKLSKTRFFFLLHFLHLFFILLLGT